jgi:hypothetical protein
MKTYTIEELKLAQAKGCRIEFKTHADAEWKTVAPLTMARELVDEYEYRIHPADEWRARLPRLREGVVWHRKDFTNEMLEGGYRPLIKGEPWQKNDQIWRSDHLGWEVAGSKMSDSLGCECVEETRPCRTRRPVPPEFLHESELAAQSEESSCAISHDAANAPNLRDPKGFCKVCGTDWPDATPETPAPDYGEPWIYNNEGTFYDIEDRDGVAVTIGEDDRSYERAVVCVNSMAGVPDPAAFVAEAREMQKKIARLEWELAIHRGDIAAAQKIEREGGLK